MTEKPAPSASQAPEAPHGPVPARATGPTGASAPTGHTEAREDLMRVVTNALHGWHNPTCVQCGKRALEVLDALEAHGYRITKESDRA